MTNPVNPISLLRCKCESVEIEVRGEAIVSTVCHCKSCQTAGHQLEALPGATPVLDGDGGTPFILFRKDRVRCLRGESLLAEHRLDPNSPTRRIVAACCNTAMFLDFTKGHWVTVYSGRLPDAERRSSRRSLDGFGRVGVIGQLVWTWAKMGFKTPTIDFVRGGKIVNAS